MVTRSANSFLIFGLLFVGVLLLFRDDRGVNFVNFNVSRSDQISLTTLTHFLWYFRLFLENPLREKKIIYKARNQDIKYDFEFWDKIYDMT